MTRLYADPVEVQRHDTGLGPDPARFLWRGRLYVVREVLARWTESGGWWRAPAFRAMTAGDDAPRAALPALETAPVPSSPKWAQRAWGEPAPDVGASVGPAGVDDGERDWWRVEAWSGRHQAELLGATAGAGVYDLCLEGASGRWSLARVVD